jgi:hypothetical protein
MEMQSYVIRERVSSDGQSIPGSFHSRGPGPASAFFHDTVTWLIPVSIIHMDTDILIVRVMLAVLGRWNRAGLESLKSRIHFPFIRAGRARRRESPWSGHMSYYAVLEHAQRFRLRSASLPNLNVSPLRSLPRDEEKKKRKENTKEKRRNSADGGKKGTFTAQQVTTVVPASRLEKGGRKGWLDGLLTDT